MFKEKLKELGNTALEISGQKAEYSNEDLVNASLIFMEVVSNLMYDYQKDKVSYDELLKSGEDMGSELRQFLIKYIGLDMHQIMRELSNK